MPQASGTDFFEDLISGGRYTIVKSVETEGQTRGFDYLSFCEKQIFPGFAVVPEQYRADHPRNRFFSEVTRKHGLTELPVLNEKVRQRLALAISKCIENDEHFALVISDADQLKHLNDIAGRPMGDLGIKANAAEMIRQLVGAGLGDDAYVFAAGESPDEVAVFVRNLDSDKIEKLRQVVAKRNGIRHKVRDVPVNQSDGTQIFEGCTFSGSAGLSTSFDQSVAAELADFRKIIEHKRAASLPVIPAYSLFDILKTEADDAAHKVKEKREKDTFPDLDFYLTEAGPEEASSAITTAYAGKRTSPLLFSAITALERLRGHSDSENMTPEQKATEIKRLSETIESFIEG